VQDHVKKLVLRELADAEGWRDLDEGRMTVWDVSGAGGSLTYKVMGAGGLAVSVRLNTPAAEDAGLRQRLSVVSRIMHAHHITSRRLAEGVTEGKSFVITDWLNGRTLTQIQEEDTERAVQMYRATGALLAQIHSIDTSWFNEFREQILLDNPQLQGVADGSHAWKYFTRGITYQPGAITGERHRIQKTSFLFSHDSDGQGDLFRAWADCGSWCPQHPVAQVLYCCYLFLTTVVAAVVGG